MNKIIGDAEITLRCGHCGHKTNQKVAQLQKEPKLTCPKCATVTDIDVSQFRARLLEVGKALNKFEKTFSDLSKRR